MIADVSTWIFGDVRPVSDDLRSFPISCGGKWPSIQFLETLSPFEPSSLTEGASRKTLTLRVPRDLDEPFGAMEDALLKLVSKKSKELLGKKQSEEQLRESYKPLSKKTGDYPRTVRAKVNQGGQYGTRYWDADRAVTKPPEAHAGQVFNAILNIRSLWVSADAWGLVCDAAHLQLVGGCPVECPFAGGPPRSFIERRDSSATLLSSHPLMPSSSSNPYSP
jgi:hypothetical protein